MIISGLLLTLRDDARLAESVEAALRARPEFTVAPRAQRWLPAVAEAPTAQASRDLHDWLCALPGVAFVDVVQVNFEEEEPAAPAAPAARQPSGAPSRSRSSRRQTAAAASDAGAPPARFAFMESAQPRGAV